MVQVHSSLPVEVGVIQLFSKNAHCRVFAKLKLDKTNTMRLSCILIVFYSLSPRMKHRRGSIEGCQSGLMCDLGKVVL